MGLNGSGKSTLAHAVSKQLCYGLCYDPHLKIDLIGCFLRCGYEINTLSWDNEYLITENNQLRAENQKLKEQSRDYRLSEESSGMR